MATEQVNVRFGADTGPLRSGVNQAKQALGGLKSTALQVAGAFGVAFGVRAFTQFSAGAVKAAAEFEKLKLALSSVASAGESVDDIVKLSTELAKMPSLGLNEVVKAFVQLKAVGQSTGQAERTIREIGNAVASAGGGVQQFEQAIYAIQQIVGNGKLMGQDLNQLKNAIPSVGAAMVKAFGTASVDAISDADKQADVFLSKLLAVLEVGPRVQGGLANTMENFAMAAERAKASIGGILATLVGPEMESATQKLEKLAELLQGNGGPLQGIRAAEAATGMPKGQLAMRGFADWMQTGWRKTLGLPSLIGQGIENRANDVYGSPEAQAQKMLEGRIANQQAEAMAASKAISQGSAGIFEQARLAVEDAKRRRPEMGPGTPEERDYRNRLLRERAGNQMGESINVLQAGLDASIEKRKGLDPGSVIADSLASIGGGGGVFGTNNPMIGKMDAQIAVLENSLAELKRVNTSIKKGRAMQ